MTRLFLWLALALILATNGFVLAGVAYNRSGEPQAIITLTERDAHISYSTEDNSGLALRLDWQQDSRPYSEERDPGWFNQAKLESLGFDCSMPLTDVSAEQHYRKTQPRKAYVVLEHGGKSWEAWFAKQKARVVSETRKRHDVEKEIENLEKISSRLVAIDVGIDPVRLRALYPDRTQFIVAPAEVWLVFVNELIDDARKYHKSFLYGSFALLVQEIHVPVELSDWLDQIRKAEQKDEMTLRFGSRAKREDESLKQGPRYNATLHYGQKHEPWVVEIKPLTDHL